MKINFAYKFRIYPNNEQKVLLAKHFGCIRFVWNYFLDERQQYYLNNKEEIEAKKIKSGLNYYDNCRELTKLKTKEEYEWLKEVNSQSLQSTLKYLNTAYASFFKNKSKYPKFKSKNNKQSFTIPQYLKINNNRLYIPKFNNGIRIKEHRKIDFTKEKFVVATLSKSCTDQYYISIIVEKDIPTKEKLQEAIGIDLGIKDFCVCSNGEIFENKKNLSKKEKRLKYFQRQFSKKVKESNKRLKAKLKVAKIHQKISNLRKDYLHKISNKLTNENQVICLEDLNIKGMIKNHNQAKAINDCSWGEFVRMLEYKAKWKCRDLIKTDRYFPSSQICSNSECGFQNEKVKNLKIREWTCPKCNTKHDRDINAAINILRQGLKLLKEAGTAF